MSTHPWIKQEAEKRDPSRKQEQKFEEDRINNNEKRYKKNFCQGQNKEHYKRARQLPVRERKDLQQKTGYNK